MAKWQSTAGPRQTKQAEESLSELDRRKNMYVELTGIVGGEERRSTLWAICGGGQANESFLKAWNTVGERFAWTITRENYQQVVEAAKEAAKTVELPIVDKRETLEQIAERNRVIAEADAKRKAQEEVFNAAHCLPERVTVPAGSMAVTLQMTYDNSDPMSDYFQSHASYGPEMLLAIVPTGRRTEALARSVLSRYPTLAALSWKWHVEEYSMGHGTYLQSEYTSETADRTTCGHNSNPLLCYEIEFCPCTHARELLAWREYPGTGPAIELPPAADGGKATVRENEQHDGIEVRFPAKPDPAVLSTLKAAGWRWSRFSKCWYTRRTPQAMDFARQLTA